MSFGDALRRPMLIYWGRRGPMTQFASELLSAGDAVGIKCAVSLSRHNPGTERFRYLDSRLVEVPTFLRANGVAAGLWRTSLAWRRLREGMYRTRSDSAIVLMPHVWSPLIVPRLKAAGFPVAVIIHDARGHLGDPTGLVNWWLLRAGRQSDLVLTLSNVVAANLIASGFDRERVHALFHPDLSYSGGATSRGSASGPLKLLIFGRALAYKGLWLCLDALEILKQQGVPFEATLVGEGDLGQQIDRLHSLGVRVINRWVGDEEIAGIFAAHDAIVLTHVEASQSGVLAVAAAKGLPAVVTPVGGLVEQVKHGETGLIAGTLSAYDIARCIRMLIDDRGLLESLRDGLARNAGHRSPALFLQAAMAKLTAAART